MSSSGTAATAVKLEPAYDDEDNRRQLTDLFLNNTSDEVLDELVPLAPAATPVSVQLGPAHQPAQTLETLESAAHTAGSLLERHKAILGSSEVLNSEDFTTLLVVKDEPHSEGEWQSSEQQGTSGDEQSDSSGRPESDAARGKPWGQQDMDRALDALRNRHMSLTKASSTYGIPSTTLWQRARRLGIHTPKRDGGGGAKSWREADLCAALRALRAGAVSANKASKAYGIPSSTLYKIARREGIRLAAPFNAAPVSWRRGDLQRALHAIRGGRASVQRAAAHYGIPTGTLYGRCKREGIELSRSNPTPWSEDAMGEALQAVRIGQMSINQAAIHYNLPYSSLYGRFKRCKYPVQPLPHPEVQNPLEMGNPQDLNYHHQMPGYQEPDPTQQPYSHEFTSDNSPSHGDMLQDPFSGQTVYYTQSFSSIVTS